MCACDMNDCEPLRSKMIEFNSAGVVLFLIFNPAVAYDL